MVTAIQMRENKMLEKLAMLEQEQRWIAEHKAELIGKYHEQFIAVQGCHVIGSGKNRSELLENIKNLLDPSAPVAIELISTRKLKFLV